MGGEGPRRGRAQGSGDVLPHLVEEIANRTHAPFKRQHQSMLSVKAMRDVFVKLGSGVTDERPVAGAQHRQITAAQPGRFAGTYRAIFGETPSTTLQRAPGTRFTAL